jgi:hypothetical protein
MYPSGVKFKPVVPREQYTLTAVRRAFPSGEWVQDRGEIVPPSLGLAGESSEITEPPSAQAVLTIIGGTKYDEDALAVFAREHKTTCFIVGGGRGAESVLAKEAWDVEVIAPDPDRYGKSARKVNVEQVLCVDLDSPLLLVGSGERVKQAKDWLKRTRSKREVIELP